VLGLGWQHVDFKHRLLRIDRALQRQPDGSLLLVDTKTQRSKRVIPVPPSVLAALVRREARQREEREIAGASWHDSDRWWRGRMV
jgi:integrase